MSFGFFCHNIALNGECVWVPPDLTDIVAEPIYTETTTGATLGWGAAYGVLGTDGAGKLICNPTGRKIVSSDDYGETWATHDNALPASEASPGDALYWLVPSVWQYYGGRWHTQLNENESNAANAHAYAADFVSGTFSYGVWNDDRGAPPTYDRVGNRNGRYSRASMVWDASGLVAAGRWGSDNLYPGGNIGGTFGNYIAIARYASNEGSNVLPGSYRNVSDNNNTYLLTSVAGGYLCLRWDGVRMNIDWHSSDFTGFQTCGRDSLGTAALVKLVTNESTNAVVPRTATRLDLWESGYNTTTIPAVNPSTGGAGVVNVSWSGHNWLCITGVANILRTSYSVLNHATAWTRGPRVILPSAISSSGSDANFQNLFYMGDGWYVGYYLDSVDQKLRVYRFRYGTADGYCPLGWGSIPPPV